ncbi:MAG: FG-GAP-like repeat-containing protein, partial [Bacteroidota bacterium]
FGLVKAQFGAPSLITFPRHQPIFDLGDFDNDGDIDVVGSSYQLLSRVTFYENADQVGDEWMAYNLPITNNEIDALKVGDFNNDGWLDFVTHQDNVGYTIYENTGNDPGVFFIEKELGLNTFLIHARNANINIHDWNSDGNLDIIYLKSGALLSATNDAVGNFTSDTLANINLPPLTYLSIYDLQVLDLDVDGDQDIVVSYIHQNGILPNVQTIAWFENLNGLGDFDDITIILQNTISPTGDGSLEVEFADFNADGLPDLLYQNDNEIHVAFQSSSNTFTNISSTGFPNKKSQIITRDLDGDGRIDFFAHPNSWYRNVDNDGNFELVDNNIMPPNFINLSTYHQFQLADIEGDGDLDYFLENHVGSYDDKINGIYFLRNEDAANPFEVSEVKFISENINGFNQTLNIDLDEDGDEDLLINALDAGKVFWKENTNGLGDFGALKLLLESSTPIVFNLDLTPGDLDGDGDLDLVGMDWVNNSNESEFFIFEKIDAAPTFAPRQVIHTADEWINNTIKITDWDSDGDNDLVVAFFERSKILSNEGNFSFQEIEEYHLTGLPFAFEDINGDGLLDFYSRDSFIYVAIQDGTGNLTSETITSYHTERGQKIIDLDNDGDLDFLKMEHVQGSTYHLVLVLNENGTYTEEIIIPDLIWNGGFGNPIRDVYDVADIDGDGRLDIFTHSRWYRQLGNVFDYSLPLSFFPNNSATFVVLQPNYADFNGDGNVDIYGNYNADGLLWIPNLSENSFWIEGKVYLDHDNDCEWTTDVDTTLNNWLVEIKGNGQTLYTSTNTNGSYTALLPDSGNYAINVQPPSIYFSPCFTDSLVAVNDTLNATVCDIPVQAETACPLLAVEISMGMMRPCIASSISFQYCNYGTVTADDAVLEVQLDSNLIINSTSIPWTTQTDSSFIFELGNVSINACDQIIFDVTPDCSLVTLGDIVCVAASVTPDSLCLPSNQLWDGSTITVDGTCDADSTTFYLKNTGVGAMDEPRNARVQIVNDEIIMLLIVDTFQLELGETKTITVANDDYALRVEAEQDNNHPVVSTASTIVSYCSTLPVNIANNLIFNFPNHDGDPFRETSCREITGSYDPNFKAAFPRGTHGRFIEKDWELTYDIHFQNEGTDTAFTVIVRDTIAPELDLSTLRIGASSHDMQWELTTARELIFTFDNILLPDKNTDEPRSHGFLQFFIQPVQDILPGTDINNEAAIYFDFNEPIITENVRRTIRVPTYANASYLDLCEGEIFQNQMIASDTILIDTTSISGQGLFVDFYHLNIFPSDEMIDTMMEIGSYYNGVLIQSDTIITETYFENGCEQIRIVTISILTDVEDLDFKNEIKIFPNPASNQLMIKWKSNMIDPQTIEIIKYNGQVLEKRIVENDNSDYQIVNVRDWRSGVYLLKTTTPFGVVYHKFIVLK